MAGRREKHVRWEVADFVFAGVFGGLYAAILVFFHYCDVYDTHFFGTKLVFVYNIVRVIFAVYLIAIAFGAGSVLFRIIDRGRTLSSSLSAWHKLLASTLLGIGIWYLLMLVLGHVGALRWYVLAPLTLLVLLISSAALRQTLEAVHGDLLAWWRRLSFWDACLSAALATALACSMVLICTMKGLYPDGGHDYYLHYHYYFMDVVKNGSVLPNNTWYHYFYSKGMAFTILAMILTDPLGGSLSGLALFLIALAAMVELVRRSGAGHLLAVAGATILTLIYCYTPGEGWVANNGGWGQFESNHMTNAALLMALVWSCTALVRAKQRPELVLWFFVAASLILALGVVTVQTILLVGLVVFVMFVYYLARGRRDVAVAFFGLGCTVGLVGVAVLTLNFLVTGVPSDQFLIELWPFVDLDRVRALDWLYLIVYQKRALTGHHDAAMSLSSAQTLDLVSHTFRWRLIAPLFVYGVMPIVVIGSALWSRRSRDYVTPLQPETTTLALFLAVVLLALADAGTAQPISFVRYTSFTPFLLVALACCLWGWLAIAWRWLSPAASALVREGVVAVSLVAFLATGVGIVVVHTAGFGLAARNAFDFFLGNLSLYSAYKTQDRTTSLPWGAIHPGAEGVWRALGRGKTIRSFHHHTYCMLPGCRIESWPPQTLRGNLGPILRSTPEEVKETLKSRGFDYFLYVDSLGASDILLYSPLFAPENIGKFLGVAWTDGDATLLTWHGPGVTPLTDEWIKKYAAKQNGLPKDITVDILDRAGSAPPNARWGSQWTLQW